MNDQLRPEEPAVLLKFATEALSVEGDFVELGCYRGDTSILFAELLRKNTPKPVEKPAENSEKRLWVYDSFAGLPAKTAEDSSGAGANFQEGELFVSKREVVDKLRRHGFRNVIVKKAWFNELESKNLPEKIAFAFCDGDLYSSIKTSLGLVLPRLSERGIIVVHDYNNPELPGATKVVDEFLRKNPIFLLKVQSTLAILTKKC